MKVKAVLPVVVLLAACLAVPAASAGAATAQAVQEQMVNATNGPLRLAVSRYPLNFRELTPGDAVAWLITPRLDDGLSGELSLQILSDGPLAKDDAGARLLLQRCGEPWVQERCGSGAGMVVDGPLSRLEPAAVHDLGTISSTDGSYFRATLSLPKNLPDRLQASTATFALGFTAMGDEETVVALPPGQDRPRERLPLTGTNGIAGMLALGLAMMGTGLLLRRRYREGRHP